MKKLIIPIILFFILIQSVHATIEITPKNTITINPGEFQSFMVDVSNKNNTREDVLLFLNSPQGITCYFQNYNTVDVLNLNPYETRTIIINIYANINISSQKNACLLNYVVGMDKEKLDIFRNISRTSEIVVGNHTIQIGRVQPIYVVLSGNTTIPAYYMPSRVAEVDKMIKDYTNNLHLLYIVVVAEGIIILLLLIRLITLGRIKFKKNKK
jgi:hypothetical protein